MREVYFSVVLVFILVCSPFYVAGLGVSPAAINLVYDKSEGIDESFNLRVVATSQNTRFVDIKIVEYNTPFGLPEGTVLFNSTQMSEYVILSDEVIDVSKENTFKVRVKIPPYSQIYGPNCFGIQMSERPEGGGGFFAVTTAVLLKVSIDAPYPGQYLDITKFKIDNVNEGETSKLYWQVKGRGEQETPFSGALKIIYEKNKSVVFERDLGVGSVKRLEVYPPDYYSESLPTNTFTPGTYTGVLTVKFLNNVKTATSKFNVGYESVELDNYTPSTLVYGNINEVKLSVSNLWNGNFNNVYGVITILWENTSGIKATTPSGFLTPFGTLELKQFVDTRSLPEGNYSAEIDIYFDNLSAKFPAKFEVAKEIIVSAGENEKNKKEFSSTTYLIIGLSLGILLLLALLIVFVFRQKNRDKQQHTEQSKAKK